MTEKQKILSHPLVKATMEAFDLEIDYVEFNNKNKGVKK